MRKSEKAMHGTTVFKRIWERVQGFFPPYPVLITLFLLIWISSPLSAVEDVEIELPKIYFSPNQDGILDTMIFQFKRTNDKIIEDWTFEIYNEAGKEIKRFRADVRHKSKSKLLSFIKKSEELAEKKVNLPPEIEWTGIGDDGKTPPDGRYIFRLHVFYGDRTEWKSMDRMFYLDRTTPIGKPLTDLRIFFPNGDKAMNTVSINHQTVSEISDRWTGTIYNEKEIPIKTYFWDNKTLPKQIKWDGKDDRGIPMPEGFYRYRLRGEDFSENAFFWDLKYIQIANSPKTDAIAEVDEFSPDGDKLKDKVHFYLFAPTEKKIEFWKLSIQSEIDPLKEVRAFTSYEAIPEFVEWDGKDGFGNLLPDGNYIYTLEIIAVGGKKLSSLPKKVYLNTAKPEIEFKILSTPFTPDGDGENDALEIFPILKNIQARTWKISIVEKYLFEEIPRKRVIKSWKGLSNPPERILWDGMGDDGIPVSSLTHHEIYFSFTNEYGQYKTYKVKNMETGLMVKRKDTDQLRISIPEYVFRERGDGEVISEIKSILKLYPGYRVELQAHSKQPGDNKENLRRTENRAKSLYNKIFGNTVRQDIFTFRGFGEVELLYMEEDEYKQEKNDRIDLVLSIQK
ncbi:MAG: hypothetical protein H7A24_00080 [Leptospiraceae bacterium]|nr:hypothetical protein [Leptospiraceae bacterium]MCP5510249.1 hypothetical protein [Leptospiraceae bacterium]